MSNSQTHDILKVSNQLMDYVTVSKNPLNLIEMKEKVKPKKKSSGVTFFVTGVTKFHVTPLTVTPLMYPG